MTLIYTTASQHLPENKMRLYPTKVINIIGTDRKFNHMKASMARVFGTQTPLHEAV